MHLVENETLSHACSKGGLKLKICSYEGNAFRIPGKMFRFTIYEPF